MFMGMNIDPNSNSILTTVSSDSSEHQFIATDIDPTPGNASAVLNSVSMQAVFLRLDTDIQLSSSDNLCDMIPAEAFEECEKFDLVNLQFSINVQERDLLLVIMGVGGYKRCGVLWVERIDTDGTTPGVPQIHFRVAFEI